MTFASFVGAVPTGRRMHVMETGESTLVQIALAGGTGGARSSCSAHPAARSVVEIGSSASISERRM